MWHFIIPLDLSTSSPEQEAESLETSFLGMCQSAPSNWKNTLGLSCSSDSATGSCHGSLSGTMFGPSMESLGLGPSTLSAAASLARIFPRLGRVLGSPENIRASGLKCSESSKKFSHLSFSSKTAPSLFPEDLIESLMTLPAWGHMKPSGELSERMTPDFPIVEKGSGSWPTPKARDWRSGGTNPAGVQARIDRRKNQGVIDLPDAACLRLWRPGLTGLLNPSFSEKLMGWPPEWTDLKPLETARFQQWLHSHGRC